MVTNPDVERVAETHFLVRPVLVNALRRQSITDAGRAHLRSDAATYYDRWVETFADRWFDMASIIRLGSAIETGLRDVYLRCSGKAAADGVFQRLVKDSEIRTLFQTDCAIDLAAIAEWADVRTVMLHRHLYAHRSGAVDDKYLSDYVNLTGHDITPRVVAHGYPAKEVYWFRPLTSLGDYIEATRRFFRALP
jgi:hypothetical protein